MAQGIEEGFKNAYVGDKDYRALGVSDISFLARHDEGEGFMFQAARIPTSIVLYQALPVPSSDGQEPVFFPRVWTTSDNEMGLGEGWVEFQFDIPSHMDELPEGWHAFPDEPETWQRVISDVDKVMVVFGRYDIDIGGAILLWLNAIDNFTVERGGNEPVDVPAVSRTGLVSLIVLTLLVGLAGLLRQRRIGWPDA